MVKYSRELDNFTKSCKARGSDLRVHFKNTREIAQAIKKLPLAKAKRYLEDDQGHWLVKSIEFLSGLDMEYTLQFSHPRIRLRSSGDVHTVHMEELILICHRSATLSCSCLKMRRKAFVGGGSIYCRCRSRHIIGEMACLSMMSSFVGYRRYVGGRMSLLSRSPMSDEVVQQWREFIGWSIVAG
eukprot:Gb_35907 [translate_table: standard]